MIYKPLRRIPWHCHFLFPHCSEAVQRILAPSEIGSWAAACLLLGGRSPMEASQWGQIHYHLPAPRTAWPRLRSLPAAVCLSADLRCRRRVADDERSVFWPVKSELREADLRIRDVTEGSSSASVWQIDATSLNLCVKEELNIDVNSLARWQYMWTGVFLMEAFCLILCYLWVVCSHC